MPSLFVYSLLLIFAIVELGSALPGSIAGRLYTERLGSSAVFDGGDVVLIIGGFDTFTGANVRDISLYNLTNRAVFPLPSFQNQGFAHGAAVADSAGNIFYFGGIDDQGVVSSDVWKLTFENTNPQVLTSLPVPLSHLAAVYAGDEKIYIIGGDSGNERISSIYEFNTETISFQLVGSLQLPTSSLSAVWVDGSVFIFGGQAESNPPDVVQFTPSTGEVETLSSVIGHRAGSSALVVENFAYVIGGGLEGDEYIIRYDTASGNVARFNLDVNPPRFPYHFTSAIYTGATNQIVVFGGTDIVNIHALDKIMRVDL